MFKGQRCRQDIKPGEICYGGRQYGNDAKNKCASLELAFRILYAFVEDLQAIKYGGNYSGADGSTFERIAVFSRWQ